VVSCWAKCLKNHNLITMYPLDKCAFAPSVKTAVRRNLCAANSCTIELTSSWATWIDRTLCTTSRAMSVALSNPIRFIRVWASSPTWTPLSTYSKDKVARTGSLTVLSQDVTPILIRLGWKGTCRPECALMRDKLKITRRTYTKRHNVLLRNRSRLNPIWLATNEEADPRKKYLFILNGNQRRNRRSNRGSAIRVVRLILQPFIDRVLCLIHINFQS